MIQEIYERVVRIEEEFGARLDDLETQEFVTKSSPTPGSYWSTTGNAGTNPAVNYVGTSDAIEFVIAGNATEYIRLVAAGVRIASGYNVLPQDANGQALGDTGTIWDLYTRIVTFGGATSVNRIVIPSNLADGLAIQDGGPVEYVKFISSVAQRQIRFNDGGADIDFTIEASGVNDALVVRGSDGVITLGQLTGGAVVSTAAGLLSSTGATIGAALVGDGVSIALNLTPNWQGNHVFSAGLTVAAAQVLTFNATAYASAHGVRAALANSVGLYIPWIAGDGDTTMYVGSSNASNNRIAIEADSYSNNCILGTSYSGAGIYGVSTTGYGGHFVTTSGYGILCDGPALFKNYIYRQGDLDTYVHFQEDQFTLVCGGVTMMDAVESANDYVNFPAGMVYVNETANSFMTQGLTINQGANDDTLFGCKSSDIAHGMTDRTETDTYFEIRKISATTGGALLNGYTEDEIGALIIGAGVNDDTTKSTAGAAYVELRAYKKAGTGVDVAGADANLVVIRNYTTTRFIFDAEGSAHADVEWTTFSDGRFKENIQPCQYGLSHVLALRPVVYDKYSGCLVGGVPVFDGNIRKQIGFIAQDVLEVIPEAVKVPRDHNSLYSLNDAAFTPVLVGAIQELFYRLEKMEGITQ